MEKKHVEAMKERNSRRKDTSDVRLLHSPSTVYSMNVMDRRGGGGGGKRCSHPLPSHPLASVVAAHEDDPAMNQNVVNFLQEQHHLRGVAATAQIDEDLLGTSGERCIFHLYKVYLNLLWGILVVEFTCEPVGCIGDS